MAKAYYSLVLDHPADDVWAVIRPFDHYAWAGVEAETLIEDGKAGDQVGAVRRVETPDRQVRRQRLLAHSDVGRSYTYQLCEPSPYPVRNFVATLRVMPVIDSNRAFVDWSAEFDCAAEDSERWSTHFAHQGFATWLGALRAYMANVPA